uniref:Putative DNA binding, helix-turn-helix domain containing protein n=1 Tax=viral metagenome TaxID=1070528 RepID=A0A6M3MEU5_9ZZZZ
MKPRQEVDLLQDVLKLIKEKPRRKRSIVISTYLTYGMWRKYWIRMMELDLIREVEVETGKKVFEITPKGDDLLNLIGVFKSVWHSFPPKLGESNKAIKS